MNDYTTAQARAHGDPSLPTLVFLPGLHGDWTLIGPLRRALSGRVRFVELTYPRTTSLSCEAYAGEVKSALVTSGVHGGWLLAESFGSQVAWPLVAQAGPELAFDGLILAGGFARHPCPWAVRRCLRVLQSVPAERLLPLARRFAARLLRRSRNDEGLARELEEFVLRRTDEDNRAAEHRLKLIAESDPRPLARSATVPVHLLHGIRDVVVFWPAVRRWLKKHCPGWRGSRCLWAGHPVLVTAPGESAEAIARWMRA